MKLSLEITTGNAAMLDAIDVAEALRKVAARIANSSEALGDFAALAEDGPYVIRDLNGGRVGTWSVAEEEAAG